MAITGRNRIEARLTKDLYAALNRRTGSRKPPRGVCFRDSNELLAVAKVMQREYEATSASARQAATRAAALKASTELKQFVAELTQDNDRLQARNKSRSRFPACLYPSTGELATEGGQETRFKRRGTAYHEQFHAAVRNIEAENGLDYMNGCMISEARADLTHRYGDTFTNLLRLARPLGWSDTATTTVEETLARAEEVRKSCRRSVEDCDAINRFMAGQMDTANFMRGSSRKWPRTPTDTCSVLKLAQGIERDFGAPTGVYRQAAAKCARGKKP